MKQNYSPCGPPLVVASKNYPSYHWVPKQYLDSPYSTILSYQEYRHHSTTSALKSNGTLSAKALVSTPLIEN